MNVGIKWKPHSLAHVFFYFSTHWSRFYFISPWWFSSSALPLPSLFLGSGMYWWPAVFPALRPHLLHGALLQSGSHQRHTLLSGFLFKGLQSRAFRQTCSAIIFVYFFLLFFKGEISSQKNRSLCLTLSPGLLFLLKLTVGKHILWGVEWTMEGKTIMLAVVIVLIEETE